MSSLTKEMMTAGGVIAVDWGTTNRRAYRLEDGHVTHRSIDENRGVLSIAEGEFPHEIAELRRELGEGPMILVGMVGSNRGWIETPYVPCPAGIAELRTHAIEPQDGIRIIPGLCWTDTDRSDVMRGEEVQILGAVHSGLVPPDAAICHPGTHAKWAKVTAGRITAFRTVMTGEIFALLRGGGILAGQLAGEVAPDADFAQGVMRGWTEGALSADLFAARADSLLDRRSKDATSFVSGLLIGCDLRAGMSFFGNRIDDQIYVIGDTTLTTLYGAALEITGLSAIQIDGERALIAGINALVEGME